MARGRKKETEVEDAASLLEKYRDVGAVLANDPVLPIDFISTGISTLDHILGGGIPRNRITLEFGQYASGKTFLTQKIIESVQKSGGLAAFCDAELKLDPEWVENTGVDLSQLLVIQDNRGEQVLDIVMELVQDVDLVVVDSIAALVPQGEGETGMSQDTIGGQARLINKFFRKLLPRLRPQDGGRAAVVMLNQVRKTIGGYIPLDSYPGGAAQQFYSSIIMKVSRGTWHTEDGKFLDKSVKLRTGFDINVRTEKNSVHRPFQQVSIPFSFTGEIDPVRSLARMGIDEGVVNHTGQIYEFGNVRGRGQGKFISELRSDESTQALLADALAELAEQGGVEDGIGDEGDE